MRVCVCAHAYVRREISNLAHHQQEFPRAAPWPSIVPPSVSLRASWAPPLDLVPQKTALCFPRKPHQHPYTDPHWPLPSVISTGKSFQDGGGGGLQLPSPPCMATDPRDCQGLHFSPQKGTSPGVILLSSLLPHPHPLWLEKMYDFNFYKHLLRIALWSSMCSILEEVPCTDEKNMYSVSVKWNVQLDPFG